MNQTATLAPRDPTPSRYDYDLFVIGGGSGGVRCARIAAGHGARVAIAEDTYWGGTCVNVGCVPKKIMVQASEYGDLATDAEGFGWSSTAPKHDWATLIAHKDEEIGRLNGIYRTMLGGSGVTLFDAHAAFVDAHTLRVGAETVTAERIVIATGGHPSKDESVEGFDLGIVSDAAFHLPSLPARILLVGGGYIGVEFAGIFAGLGASVDVVYRAELPVRGFDQDLRERLAEGMTANGVRLHPNDAVVKVEAVGEARLVTLKSGRQIETDLVFFALGRDPRTAGLGLAEAGVTLDRRGRVVVDGENRTSQAHIYAIGDVSNRLNLTPVALAEGHHLADRLFSRAAPRTWSFDPVATAVFSNPSLATVGPTEDEAAARGPVDVYTTSFTPMRRIMARRPRKTFMKLIVDQATQRVLAAHMIGDDVAEMMQGVAVAITAGATKQDFDRTIGIHPTGGEEFVTLRTRTRVAGARAEAAE